jgi:hypothetical protein
MEHHFEFKEQQTRIRQTMRRFSFEVVVCPVTETNEHWLFVRELVWLIRLGGQWLFPRT